MRIFILKHLMSLLNKNITGFISSKLTKLGRRAIANGNFQIKYFQIGDSEYDYNLSFFDGLNGRPNQITLSPMDGDKNLKYPFLFSENQTETFGQVIIQPSSFIVKNKIGSAGFVGSYKNYDANSMSGTSIKTISREIPINFVDGTNILLLSNASDFEGCDFITLLFNTTFNGTSRIIKENVQSLIYKIISITNDEITLDRKMPNLSEYEGSLQVVCNKYIQSNSFSNEQPICLPLVNDSLDQQESWSSDIVWTETPAGVDENVTSFVGTQLASIKEYLGYNSNGQIVVDYSGGTIENPTTFVNSFGELINVTPDEQRVIAVLHFSENGDLYYDSDRFLKYDDYISCDNNPEHLIEGNVISDLEYFEVYIPFLLYHRSSNSMIGAKFHMDSTDYFVKSIKNERVTVNQIKFRYLLDENNYRVGRVYLDKRIIVFDDQDIVATLDYKSNRKWTLPSPKYSLLMSDITLFNDPLDYVVSGGTVWVTYFFKNTSDPYKNGLQCNYYGKLISESPSNIGLKFSEDDLRFMTNEYVNGYSCDEFYALIQVTNNNSKPSPDQWKMINLTNQIKNHTLGQNINRSNMVGYQFIITGSMVEDADFFTISEILGENYDTNFGERQPFAGSIRLVRASEVEIMNCLVNLPSSQFITSQNPTFSGQNTPKISEIGLFNERKELVVISKLSTPINRLGNQIFPIKLDF